jgi:hypothetical protein
VTGYTSYASASLFVTLTQHLDLGDLPPTTTTAVVDGVTVQTGGVPDLLERASEDLDAFLCWPAPYDFGRRIPVEALTPFAYDCLARATCLQAAYRLTVTEDDMTEGRPRALTIGGGQVTFSPTAPDPISPAALVLLAGAGLYKRSNCASAPAPPSDAFPPLPG